MKKTIDGTVVLFSCQPGEAEQCTIDLQSGVLVLENNPVDPLFSEAFQPGARIRVTVERVEQ